MGKRYLFSIALATLCLLCLHTEARAQNGQRLPFEHDVTLDFMGGLPGAAMFDYDNDGDLDIYVANGFPFPNRLLKNDGQGNFTDVAKQAGVDGTRESHGVATADIDNDGDLDIFVANNKENYLYLNNGDGTFTDIAKSAGVTSSYFSSTVAFADIDNDGYVDIYVGGADVEHGQGTGELYRNNGDLTFTNVTKQTGTASTYSWSVGFCDYDNDGDQDLFTANDQGISKPGEWSPIRLFRNDGNLRFTDVTRPAGLGLTGSWMGLAFGDYDQDGDLDFFATNLGGSFILDKQEYDLHGFFRNNGNGTFTNIAEQLGLASYEFGWGTAFLDFDNDGDLDLYYVGNFVMLHAYTNPGHLFINNGNATFTESTEKYGVKAVTSSGVPTISVGVATGDVNNDGHVDIFVTNAGRADRPGYPLLFTEKFDDNNWIRVKLEGTTSNRAGIGAKVRVTANGKTQVQEVASGASSFSQNSLWLTFGLGKNIHPEKIEILWPSGIVQTLESITANQTLEIREPLPSPSVIALSTNQLNFGQVEVKRSAQATLTVRNDGQGLLKVTDIRSDLPVTLSATSFEVPPGGSYDLTLTITSQNEGAFSGTLEILSNDPEQGALSLPFSGTVAVVYADPRADFNGDGQLNLSDFIAFARAFNGTDAAYDLNGDGRVDFADFLLFAQSFSRPLR